jgi:hypothetical protein
MPYAFLRVLRGSSQRTSRLKSFPRAPKNAAGVRRRRTRLFPEVIADRLGLGPGHDRR